MKNTKKGFVGLIGLLLTAFLIAYFFWKTMSPLSTSSSNPPNPSTGEVRSIDFDIIERAKDAKNMLEKGWGSP